MWHWRNSAFHFELEQIFLFGFIFSPKATLPAETDSDFYKFLI
jgi:hypothetical protein